MPNYDSPDLYNLVYTYAGERVTIISAEDIDSLQMAVDHYVNALTQDADKLADIKSRFSIEGVRH